MPISESRLLIRQCKAFSLLWKINESITSLIRDKLTVVIDVSFDESSFGMYFEEINQKNSDAAKIAKVINTFHDEDAGKEDLEEVMDLTSQCEGEDEGVSEMIGVRLKEEKFEKILFELFQSSLSEFSVYLKEKGYPKLDCIASEEKIKYLKLKFANECKKRSGLLVRDAPEKSAVEVYLKNFYETHGEFFLQL